MNNTLLADRNYNAIDLAKLMCSILVISGHIKPLGNAPSESFIAYLNFGIQNYFARIAVPFFFITAGFLLYRKTTCNDFSLVHTKRYLIRIARLYMIWTVVYFPLARHVYLTDEKGGLHASIRFIRDFVFAGIYPHLWYFPALLFAVFLISFLLTKRIHPKYILLISAIFYFFGLFAQSWFGFILPLKQHTPEIWSLLLLLKEIITSTRDGLFEAFLFVSMGMYIAFYQVRIEQKKAFVLFGFSMLAMLIEVITLQCFGFIREYDMYFFLVPATFFLFCLTLEIRLPDNPVYKTMRSLSSLIFFSHLWVYYVVSRILLILYGLPAESPFHFTITLVVTVVLSYSVIKLSECKGFHWLKLFYT